MMLKEFRINLARLIAPEEREDIDNEVGRRVARVLNNADPFEPLMREYSGIFTKEYEHPEFGLDGKSQLLMMMWAYRLEDDPSFKHLTQWVLNTQGNATIRHPNPTPETIFYGRAQIACTLLLIKEVGRLASMYRDILEKQKDDEDFNSESPIE